MGVYGALHIFKIADMILSTRESDDRILYGCLVKWYRLYLCRGKIQSTQASRAKLYALRQLESISWQFELTSKSRFNSQIVAGIKVMERWDSLVLKNLRVSTLYQKELEVCNQSIIFERLYVLYVWAWHRLLFAISDHKRLTRGES